MSSAGGEEHPREQTAPGALTGTVVRGVAFAGVGFALTQTLTLGFFIVLARLATPEEFGQLAGGMILVGIGAVFTESGMMQALIYRRDRLEEAAATAVVSTFAGGLALTLLALALSPVIGLIFDSHTVGLVAASMAALVFLRTTGVVPDAILQRRFSFLRRMVVEPIAVIVFGVTAVILTANDMGVWGLVLGYYAMAVADSALSWTLVRWRPQLRLASFGMWRELIDFGRHTIAATGVIRVSEQIPILLLGRFTGTGAVGQFRYGIRVAALPLAMIMAAASYVLFPALARISTERERFTAAFLRALRWMAVLAVPGGLILIPLGEPLVTLVFGSTWTEAGHATMALGVFCSGRALTSVIVEGVTAAGRPEIVTRMNTVEICVGTAAMAALLPFGLVGVCAGVSIGVVVRAAYAFRRAAELFAVSLGTMLRRIWAPLVAGGVMVIVLLPIEVLLVDAGSREHWLGLFLLAAEAGFGLCLYAGLVHLLAPGALDELIEMVRAVRRREPPTDEEGDPDQVLETTVPGAAEGPT
jgi:O-antigen/teichoic acid export membrane protein